MPPGPPVPVPANAKTKSTNVRRASPTRPEQDSGETTFQKKLEEIKRLRASNDTTQNPHSGETVRRVIVNGKPSLALCGDWALFLSSAGRPYFFNLRTLVNQWEKPAEWIDSVPLHFAAVDTQQTVQQLITQVPKDSKKPTDKSNGNNNGKSDSFKMKISSKPAKLKPMAELLAQAEDEIETTKTPLTALISDGVQPVKNKEAPSDDNCSSPKKSRKENSRSRSRSSCKSRSRSHSRSSSSSSSSSYTSRSSRSSSRSSAPLPKPDMAIVQAAKAQLETNLALVASQYHSGQARSEGATWLTEYNFPAVLSRCKFPKAYDALRDLTANRGRKRNPVPIFDSASEIVKSDSDVNRSTVISEIKVSANRNRIMSDKLGIVTYKISDEIWEKYFPHFQIGLSDRVMLECRPHGWTEDDKPVYSRTGKVAGNIPFSEDIVRCHAVIQAWRTDTCHCVYANKTYTIQRDNDQWLKDLEECKKFLTENGY